MGTLYAWKPARPCCRLPKRTGSISQHFVTFPDCQATEAAACALLRSKEDPRRRPHARLRSKMAWSFEQIARTYMHCVWKSSSYCYRSTPQAVSSVTKEDT